MSIIATGFCDDCETTTRIDFDEDAGGAAFCITCGSYEVLDIETEDIDDADEDELEEFADEDILDEYAVVDDEF